MTISQALKIAMDHHQAGRLAEAEALYRQVLAAQPNNPDAKHFLGVIALQVGRHDLAVEWIRKATRLEPHNPVAHSNLGEACRALGRFDEAFASYRRALELAPDYAEAHNNLANALWHRGRLDDAIASYRRALEFKPDYPQAHNNLGNALRDQGRFDEAIAAHRRALQLKPDFPEAHNNLGNALRDLGQLEGAVAAYRAAIQLMPNSPEAHNNLGKALLEQRRFDEAVVAHRRAIQLRADFPEAYCNLGSALREQGRLDDAVAACRRALQLMPDYPDAHNNLGNALRDLGQLKHAIEEYRHALRVNPVHPEAQNNLGNALRDLGRIDEAIDAYQQALRSNPDSPEAHTNLGNILKDLGRLDEAVAACRRAIQLNPRLSEAYNNLGNALGAQGQLDEAIASYRHALRLAPLDASLHSNLIYMLRFHPACDEMEIAAERLRWNRRFSEPMKQFVPPHSNERSPGRRLRIGYVSPDFRDHVVGRNLLPLFKCHDSENFEILCYSDALRPDSMTEQFRKYAQHWRGTRGLPDEALAEKIRSDAVDILVDLTQHLARNRLPLFARQPAPVQASFAGYPDSTGLEAIEYRISDRLLEANSPGHGTSRNEHLCLIDSFWCYDPCGLEIPVKGLPAAISGKITFGCLNNFCKVNGAGLKLWARVLGSVKDSRLLIASPEGSHRSRTLELLQGEGLDASRVEFLTPCPRREYLELYHCLDIVLDTFPYNGHTTSLDALWMGVPVVTLVGDSPVSRAGLSQLTNLGLPELVARSESEYVEIAKNLASDLPRVAALRATLRERMNASVLMDASSFTRQVENAFRTMWQKWCAGQPSARTEV